MVTVEGIPEAILDHRIDEAHVAHLGARAQMRGMGGKRHGFLTTRDNDIRIAIGDLLHGKRDGAQAGAANLVKAPSGRTIRNAGGDGGLTGGVLSLRRGQHLAEDHLIHLAASMPARPMAALTAAAPSLCAATSANAPLKLPTAVRAAATITISAAIPVSPLEKDPVCEAVERCFADGVKINPGLMHPHLA